MGILEAAFLVAGHVNAQVLLVERVPPPGHIPDLQGACNQGLFNLVADHDVQAVGQLTHLPIMYICQEHGTDHHRKVRLQ